MSKEFKSGQTVYAKDGIAYYFDHMAGDHGYVSPYFIVQTHTNDGGDFDETEEVSDVLIPMKLSSLSGEPWVKKIHEETAEALEEKKRTLDNINKDIGSATTQLARLRLEVAEAEKDYTRDVSELARNYKWVGTLKHMLHASETFFLCMDGKVPTHMNPPRDIRLELSDGEHSYTAVYDYDDNLDVIPFASSVAMKNAVRGMFNDAELTLADELKWQEEWTHLKISEEAEAHKKSLDAYKQAQAEEITERELERAIMKAELAQDKMDRVLAGDLTGVRLPEPPPPHPEL